MENNVAESPQKILFDYTTQAFEEIIAEITGTEAQSVDDFKVGSGDVLSVIIGVTGQINGRILLNTSLETATKLAEAMNFGDPLDNKEDLFIYLSEFGNMYCGRMVTHINDKCGSRQVWITPPAIFSASDLEVISPHILSTKKYYECEAGRLIVDVGYSDGSGFDDF